MIHKGCARCGGDLYTEQGDFYLPDVVCLQCGFRAPLNDITRGGPGEPVKVAEGLPSLGSRRREAA